MLQEDRNLIAITHLSQLLDFVTGIGGLIVPLIIWLTQRDKIRGMDETGKQIFNFKISTFIYILLCIPLMLVFGLGIFGFIIIGLGVLILPIVNAVKVNRGEPAYYPGTIQFIK